MATNAKEKIQKIHTAAAELRDIIKDLRLSAISDQSMVDFEHFLEELGLAIDFYPVDEDELLTSPKDVLQQIEKYKSDLLEKGNQALSKKAIKIGLARAKEHLQETISRIVCKDGIKRSVIITDDPSRWTEITDEYELDVISLEELYSPDIAARFLRYRAILITEGFEEFFEQLKEVRRKNPSQIKIWIAYVDFGGKLPESKRNEYHKKGIKKGIEVPEVRIRTTYLSDLADQKLKK